MCSIIVRPIIIVYKVDAHVILTFFTRKKKCCNAQFVNRHVDQFYMFLGEHQHIVTHFKTLCVIIVFGIRNCILIVEGDSLYIKCYTQPHPQPCVHVQRSCIVDDHPIKTMHDLCWPHPCSSIQVFGSSITHDNTHVCAPQRLSNIALTFTTQSYVRFSFRVLDQRQ